MRRQPRPAPRPGAHLKPCGWCASQMCAVSSVHLQNSAFPVRAVVQYCLYAVARLNASADSDTVELQAGARKLPSTGGSTISTPGTGSAGSDGRRSFQLNVPTPVTGSGGGTPHQVQQASPGATCLAILLQRCSDKSAVVRARALSNLAGVVAENLRSDGHSFRQVGQLPCCVSDLLTCRLESMPSLHYQVMRMACIVMLVCLSATVSSFS